MTKAKNNTSKLRHRLRLEEPQRVSDAIGGFITSWNLVAELWGQIQPSRGREIFVQGKLQSPHTHTVTLRYRDGVTTDMRLVYDSRIFNIRSVTNIDERGQMLELRVEEGVA